MSDFMADLRQALRGLARRPAFAAAAVSTLALGIGASTAMFAAVYRLVLAPLPFDDADRIGYPWLVAEQGMWITPRSRVVDAWRASARSLERIEVYSSRELVLPGETGPEVVRGGLISATLAGTLGVRPVLGRGFGPADTPAGAAAVALLDESYWKSRFGGDPGVIGRTLTLDGAAHTVIGVMPARLSAFAEIGEPRQVWLPLRPDTADEHVNAVVKLRAGVTVAAAEAELNAIAARVPDPRPVPGTWRTRIQRPEDFLGTTVRSALLVLLAAVGLVLLIACANVAGLLLARGEARRKEMAIRSAIGAGRGRLLRHLAAEVVLLAFGGGVLGLMVATWAVDLVRALRPAELTELTAVRIDPVILLFAAAVTMAAAALFGAGPALRTSRHGLADALKGTTGGSTTASSSARVRGALVAGQIAISLTLLIGSGLLIRSVAALQRRDPGFRIDGLLTVDLQLDGARYSTPDARAAFLEALREAIAGAPGIRSVAWGTGVPGRFGAVFGELQLEGRSTPASPGRAFASALVEPSWFRTLGVPVLEGRVFAEHEQHALVINRAMARKYWPGESAVGKRLRLSDRGEWSTVTGVAGDIAAAGPASGLESEQIYFPADAGLHQQRLLVRVSSGDELDALPAIRSAVARLDPQLPLRDVATIETLLARTISRERFIMTLLTIFALTALLLAGVGLYGVISYVVSQRTREIGVRMALGAAPRSVRGLVLRSSARLVGIGAAAGLAGAFVLVDVLATLLEPMLHGTDARDPVAYAAAVATLAAVALAASWIPAARASEIDPLRSLTAE